MADEKSRGAKINERSDLASTTIIESNKQCSSSSNNSNNNNDNIRKINNKINRQSRNGKSTRNNTNGNNGNNRRVRKRKRRFEAAAPSTSEKLPTPPPDPRDLEKRRKSLEVVDGGVSVNENESQQQQQPKLDRVRCLDGLGSAFQQLAEWHSLCEQMLELRDSNGRLFQRVRELERCKVARLIEYYLARMSSANRDEAEDACDDANELAPDCATDNELNFQLSIISSILEQSSSSSHQHQSHTSSASSPSVMAAVWPSSGNYNNNNYKSSPSSQEQLVVVSRAKSFRSPVLRQRSRSIGEVQPLANHSSGNKRSSCQIQCGGPYYTGYGANKSGKRNSIVGPIVGTFSGGGGGSTGPKVSKWTKVKAAFKWEKANMGVPAAAAAPPPTSFSSVVLEAIEHEAAQRQQQQNRLKPPETTTTGLQIDNVATAATTTTTTTTTPNSGSSPRTYEHSGPPSPGSISSSSSIDDIFDSQYFFQIYIFCTIEIFFDTERITRKERRSGSGFYELTRIFVCARGKAPRVLVYERRSSRTTAAIRRCSSSCSYSDAAVPRTTANSSYPRRDTASRNCPGTVCSADAWTRATERPGARSRRSSSRARKAPDDKVSISSCLETACEARTAARFPASSRRKY
ncbi:unnamed protein product [Trichogramma brassicae]|uniref:Uncharacterized protein n=1 Tax=Trichogramma brassicae TaxID=86971 RepID=A0A6H5IVJ6_9HYME|nr:unnamed protein product [Trichogramma brassicae]